MANSFVGWFITTIACLVALISCSTTIYWSIYGVIYRKSVKKAAIALLVVNWAAGISFGVVTILVAIHCLLILNDENDDDFITEFEADNLQTSLLIGSIFYLIGKFLLYFVLYLRLYYLLENTLFAYQKKYYNYVKCCIIATIIFAIAIVVPALFHNDNLEIISNIFTMLYLLCDIIVPIILNFMFIKKMYDIYLQNVLIAM